MRVEAEEFRDAAARVIRMITAPITCRPDGRAGSSGASTSTAFSWRTGSANLPTFWNHWRKRSVGTCWRGGNAIFADDIPVKMLAPGIGKMATARPWTHGRDERPSGSDAAPASWHRVSPDWKGRHLKDHHTEYRGWMHADGG